MAGNYLQTLNWKEDVNLMRQIENCYVKADALGSLAAFYEACAEVCTRSIRNLLRLFFQVEIDDFRDYEKGLAALNESLRRWTKNAEKEGGLEAESSEKIERLRDKIGKIKRYLAARQYVAQRCDRWKQTTAKLLYLGPTNLTQEKRFVCWVKWPKRNE